MKCEACYRDAPDRFCKYHNDAYDALKKNYDAWCNAYGKISWNEYLKKVLELKETGSWVKDVAMLELKMNKK
jgi:hypothetical protein